MKSHFKFPDGNFNTIDPVTGATIYNMQHSYKKGEKGNFVDPTNYFFCRQRLTGANCIKVKLDYEIYQKYANPRGWYPGGYSDEKWVRTQSLLTCPTALLQEQVNIVNRLKPRVVSALYEQIGKELEDFDLLTELAEVRQTASLLYETASRTSDFIFGVLKRKPSQCLKALGIVPSKKHIRRVRGILNHYARRRGTVEDAASDIWLKYRYGFTPMLYSVDDAVRALCAYNQDTTVTRAQVTMKDIAYLVDPGDYVATSLTGFKVRQHRVNKFDVSVRAYGYWSGLNNIVNSIRGHRLVDFVQTGWELVPFSFVVDWLWDLSSYLDAQRVDSRIQWRRGALAVQSLWQESVATTFELRKPTADTRISGGPQGTPHTRFYRKAFFFKREVFPTPVEFLELPDIDLSWTWKRKVDMVCFTLLAAKGRLSRTWLY